MSSSFSIIHPKPGRKFRHPFFVAYGRWLGAPGQLRGTLTDRQGRSLAEGKPLRTGGRHWALAFVNMPVGTHYRLEIRKDGSNEANFVDYLAVELGHHSITIDYPTDDDLPVGPIFLTYGTTDEGSALSAGLTPDGGGTVTSLWGPPDVQIYWAFEFDDVNVGDYTLTVSGGASSADQRVEVE
jgi:hypothetical protein